MRHVASVVLFAVLVCVPKPAFAQDLALRTVVKTILDSTKEYIATEYFPALARRSIAVDPDQLAMVARASNEAEFQNVTAEASLPSSSPAIRLGEWETCVKQATRFENCAGSEVAVFKLYSLTVDKDDLLRVRGIIAYAVPPRFPVSPNGKLLPPISMSIDTVVATLQFRDGQWRIVRLTTMRS